MKYIVELTDSYVEVEADFYEVENGYINLIKGEGNVAVFAPTRWVGCYPDQKEDNG